MASTAGIESVANTTSVTSIARITGSSDPLAGCNLRIHSDGCVCGALTNQPESGVEQKQAEDPGDPIEAFQQGDARGDEQGAQHNRSPHTPEQRVVLAFGADAETPKDDQEDKEIVDAEGGFNGVAAHPFKRRLTPLG